MYSAVFQRFSISKSKSFPTATWKLNWIKSTVLPLLWAPFFIYQMNSNHVTNISPMKKFECCHQQKNDCRKFQFQNARKNFTIFTSEHLNVVLLWNSQHTTRLRTKKSLCCWRSKGAHLDGKLYTKQKKKHTAVMPTVANNFNKNKLVKTLSRLFSLHFWWWKASEKKIVANIV